MSVADTGVYIDIALVRPMFGGGSRSLIENEKCCLRILFLAHLLNITSKDHFETNHWDTQKKKIHVSGYHFPVRREDVLACDSVVEPRSEILPRKGNLANTMSESVPPAGQQIGCGSISSGY